MKIFAQAEALFKIGKKFKVILLEGNSKVKEVDEKFVKDLKVSINLFLNYKILNLFSNNKIETPHNVSKPSLHRTIYKFSFCC